MLYPIIFILNCLFNIGGGKKCSTLKDCVVKALRYQCSICDQGECTYPFDNLFDTSSQSKCLFKAQCGSCAHGTCLQGFGGKRCECPLEYYGPDCDIPVPSQYEELVTTSVYHEYKWIVKMLVYEEILMSSQYEGMLPTYIVTNYQNYLSQYSWGDHVTDFCQVPAPNTNEIHHDPEQKCDYKYYLDIRYPYVPYRKGKSVLVKKVVNLVETELMVGYWSFIKFEIRNAIANERFPGYNESVKVFVSYEGMDLTCICVIYFENCGKAHDRAAVYTRQNHIVIQSVIYYFLEGRRVYITPDAKEKEQCSGSTIISWNFYIVDRFGTHRERLAQSEYSALNKDFLKFTPYQLDLGLHKVLLETKYLDSGHTVTNVGYCYFDILAKPLVVMIDQGEHLTVRKLNDVTLTAHRSHDPNQLPIRDKQKHVLIDWECTEVMVTSPTGETSSHPCDIRPAYYYQTWESFIIPSSKLAFGNSYRIKATIWTDFYIFALKSVKMTMTKKNTTILVTMIQVNTTDTDYGQIFIECVKNCGTKVVPSELLILKVRSVTDDLKPDEEYKWSYNKKGEHKQSADDIRVNEGPPPVFLVVKKKSLEPGTIYIIGVEASDRYMESSYSIETSSIMYGGSCTISPTKGIRGYTPFDIKCTTDYSSTFLYEFYDKYTDEIQEDLIYSGRMLGTSYAGLLYEVTLTRDNVMVYIISEDGLYVSKQLNVELEDWNITPENITDLNTNMTSLLILGERAKFSRHITSVADIYPDAFERQYMINKLFDAICQCSVSTIAESKLMISAIKILAVKMNPKNDLYLDTVLLMDSVNKLFQATKVFVVGISDIHFYHGSLYLSTLTIEHIVASILDSLYSTLELSSDETKLVNEDFIPFDLLIQLRLTSKYAEGILDYIKNLLSFSQYPGQPASKVSSNKEIYTVWVMANDIDYNITSILDSNEEIHVSISYELMRELHRRVHLENQLVLQVLSFTQNIFWWSKGFVKSNLLSVSVGVHYQKGKIKKIRDLYKPLSMSFSLSNLEYLNFTNKIYQLDSSIDSFNLDFKITIHRLDPIPGSFTQIRFLYPPTEHPLRVFIVKSYRPDYDVMVKRSVIINGTSPLYPLSTNLHDESIFYYMGILPGPDVKTNQSVLYAFEINATYCHTWSLGRWWGLGCEFGSSYSNMTVLCLCNHLSTFSVGSPPSPYDIEEYKAFGLILTVNNNYFLIILTVLLLMAYFIACIWAKGQDSNDKTLRVITILPDNFPADRFPYLVSVWTGSRFRAGTTAHVAIRLYGEDTTSRVHIISGTEHTSLTRNSDKWFIILCPYALGRIYTLQLWHDNYGSNPDWYCEKIVVYDLMNKEETLFMIREWLALGISEFPEVNALPSDIDTIHGVKSMFINNVHHGLQETHLVTSILLRHARSHINCLQRVTMLMCCVMIALFYSVLFFLLNTHLGFDEPNLEIKTTDIFIAFHILLLNLILIAFVRLAFGKSIKFTYARFQSQMLVRKQTIAGEFSARKTMKAKDYLYESMALEYFDPSKIVGKRKTYMKFLTAIHCMIRPRSKLPVHLPQSKAKVDLVKKWYVAGWALCLLVIIISIIFVVLKSTKLGDVQSKKCALCTLFALVLEILLVGPMFILLSSLIFSFTLNQQVEVSAYDIKIADIRLFRNKHDNDDHYRDLIAFRSDPMYAPMTLLAREKQMEKVWRRYYWSKLADFTVAVVFLIILSLTISHLWSTHYIFNNHLKEMFTSGHSKLGTINFFEIGNRADLEIYLASTFPRAIYNLRWYNKKLMDAQDENLNTAVSSFYRTSDYTKKMLGGPLIRQLRVSSTNCNKMVNQKNLRCIPHYSVEHEEKSAFGIGWTAARWDEGSVLNSPWQYTDRYLNWFFRQFTCYGKSRRELDYGGYMVQLGLTRTITSAILMDLEDNVWLDPFTRAVIIETTIYSANENLFGKVHLFVEYLVAGPCFLQISVSSLSGSTTFHTWEIVFILMIAYFICDSLIVMNRHGILNYLTTTGNAIQLVVILLGCTFILITKVHFYLAKLHMEKFQSSGKESYFDYDSFVYYSRIACVPISILVAVAIVKVLCLFRAGKFITQCYHAFKLNLQNTIFLAILFFSFIVIQWRLIAFVLNILLYYNAPEAFSESFHSSLGFDYHTMNKGCITSLYVTSIFFRMISYAIVVLFIHYVKYARTIPANSFNFLTFLVDQVKSVNIRRILTRIKRKDNS